jgi:membrane-associated phospholipid phosphatase
MVRFAAALAALVVIGVPQRARAQGELRWNPAIDGGIVLGGAALYIASEELLKSDLAPATCRWCDDNGLDRGWRDALRWEDTGLAGDLSNLTGYGLAPAGALGLTAVAAGMDHRLMDWPMDAVIILESMILAADVNQLVKMTAGRERPFVHALPEEDKPLTEDPADNNLSFYSGHTTFAFSLAVSAGTVATLRRYRLAPVIWAVGLTTATATGWLRMAADKHYFTDVALGAITGAAFGFSVPWLHRSRTPRGLPVPVPVQGGVGLAWSGRF